jgi:hypothetical protein
MGAKNRARSTKLGDSEMMRLYSAGLTTSLRTGIMTIGRLRFMDNIFTRSSVMTCVIKFSRLMVFDSKQN